MDITVNGKVHNVTGHRISYDAIMKLAFNRLRKDCTVTYQAGQARGTLISGQEISLVKNMVFVAMLTNSA